jgi:hypothetical protein
VGIEFTEPGIGPYFKVKKVRSSTVNENLKMKSLPLRPLLVQHTVTAILAADLVATLERDTGRALAAEVHNGGAVDVHGAAVSGLIVEGGLSAHRGDLVSFARHFRWVCVIMWKRSKWRKLMIP